MRRPHDRPQRPCRATRTSPPIDTRTTSPTSPPSATAGEPAGYLTRIPVRSLNRIVIVQVAQIRRLEAEDNYVRIWTDRPYLHKETLTGLMESSTRRNSCASIARMR